MRIETLTDVTPKRNLEIDALKGFGILLVVIGHAINGILIDYPNNLIFRVIYSFHMPLMFLLSGYIAFGRLPSSLMNLITKKSKSLLIPFLVWQAAGYGIRGFYKTFSIKDYIWSHWINAIDYAWFLWILFLIFCIVGVALKLKPIIGETSALILIALIAQVLPTRLFGIEVLKWQIIFFVIGYFLSKYHQSLISAKMWIWSISIIIFPILFPYWRYDKEAEYAPIIREFFALHSLPKPRILILALNYATALSAIAICFLIIALLSKTKVFLVLANLGRRTLEVYLGHFTFIPGIGILGVGFGIGVAKVFSAAALALLLSLIQADILKKSKFLARMLYGQWNKDRPCKFLGKVENVA